MVIQKPSVQTLSFEGAAAFHATVSKTLDVIRESAERANDQALKHVLGFGAITKDIKEKVPSEVFSAFVNTNIRDLRTSPIMKTVAGYIGPAEAKATLGLCDEISKACANPSMTSQAALDLGRLATPDEIVHAKGVIASMLSASKGEPTALDITKDGEPVTPIANQSLSSSRYQDDGPGGR